MDPITHAASGAVAMLALRRRPPRAVLVGALAAAAAVRRLWLTHYSAAVTDTAPGLAAARTAYPLALAG